MCLPSLSEIIRDYQLSPYKKLGQNFILNIDLNRKIARCVGNLDSGTIIEVGPGPGGLTRALLLEGAKDIVAIEYDNRCVRALQSLSDMYNPILKVIHGDALKIDLSSIGTLPRKIVANLPYNIGTTLLMGWLKDSALFESFTLMFQKEVAERLCALPGSKVYGKLSVMVQYKAKIKALFKVSSKSFFPQPKVDSMLVSIIPHKENLFSCNWDDLNTVTSIVFNKRRKMLRSSLRSLCENSEEVLNLAGISGTNRPEDLNVDQFCELVYAWKKIKID